MGTVSSKTFSTLLRRGDEQTHAMPTVVLDPELTARLQAERAATGADRYDEVWEGVYVMSPLADNEHQTLASKLAFVFQTVLGLESQASVLVGANLSDRETDWERNYRIPDVAVFLPDGHAQNRGTHWFGGPDLAVEITSPNDRSRDKLDFYSTVRTREFLLVDRSPWAFEQYSLDGEQLALQSKSTPDDPRWLTSRVLPLRFRLLASTDTARPRIEIAHSIHKKTWTI